MASAQEQGIPHPVEDVVASKENIMAPTSEITNVPKIGIAEGGQGQEDTPVCVYCMSRFKTAWRTKVSPFATTLRQYLHILEATKAYDSEDLKGAKLA